jgi:hypothetical protein
MDQKLFEQIASSITVKSICTPLNPDIRAEDKVDDLAFEEWQSLDSNPNNPSPVRDNDGVVVGMLWPESAITFLSEDPSDPSNDGEVVRKPSPVLVREAMEIVHVHECVSSATTILDIIELFGTKTNSKYFYVLQVNEIVGVVRYGDHLHPLGRLALLTLALEIEDLALLLCLSDPDACWAKLPKSRTEKAQEMFKLRYGGDAEEDTGRLIECTQLADKGIMIWTQGLLPAKSRAEALRFFKTLREVRDRCAHPGSNHSVLPKEELAKFVHDARAMRESLLTEIQHRGIRRDSRPYE